MFKVSQEYKNGLNLCQITDVETGEYVCILPESGCSLNNYVIIHNGKALDIVDGYSDGKDLQENMNIVFKGHLLFPFPNRIMGGSYFFKDTHYQLKKNYSHEGNAGHGLLYDKKFSLEKKSESAHEASVTLVNEMLGDYEGYPFKCLVRLRFVYSHRNLSILSEVVNTDNGEIPVSIGWHPYFKIGESINNLNLNIPASEQWDQNLSKFIPVNFSGKETLGDRFLDTCFKKESTGSVTIEDKNSGLALSIDSGSDLPYIQIYTPPHRRTIAIEPMNCVPDSFNNKVGLKVLEKDDCWVTKWSVKVINS